MENRYDKFTSLILSINRSIVKIKSMEMAELGVKGNQVQCIYHLYLSKEGKTLNELCSLCCEDKGAMSRTIADLEEKGLAEKKESNKIYKNPYTLTKEGEKIGKKLMQIVTQMVNKGSDGIKLSEREGFYKNLSIVDNNLKEVCNGYESKNKN